MPLGFFPDPSTTDTDAEEAKKRADKHRFEDDLVVLESDRYRALKKVEDMELDLRTMQKNYTAMGFAIKDKQEEMKKQQSQMQFLDEEIHTLKKKIDNL